MIKVKELKGKSFNVPLSNDTVLYLSGGQEKKIKEESISQSLLNAEKAGLVSITKVKDIIPKRDNKEDKTNNKDKNIGGAK